MSVLAKIMQEKRDSLSARMAEWPLDEVRAQQDEAGLPRGFGVAIQQAGLTLIAEIKPASPSEGTIRGDLDPVATALAYERAGAHCLSILTEPDHFGGSFENFICGRGAVSLPALRKDFTVSEYDIEVARALGADAVLLIVNGLNDAELVDFRHLAESLGMDAVVEVHSEAEAERALASGATIIGVNNRDLETLKTDLATSERILPLLPDHITRVSESALHTYEDIQRVEAAGADAVLIGTAFCRDNDPESAVKRVMNWP